MNRGELVARVSAVMGMAGSGTESALELSQLQAFANEAVLDVLRRTKIHVRRTSLLLDVGVTEYDLSQSVLRLWGLVDKDGENLTEIDSGDLARFSGSHVFQFVGYNRLAISWKPATGDTLEAWYTPRPTKMTLDANDPAVVTYGLIPEEFHRALLNFMFWQAGEISRDQQSGYGERYRRLYEGEDGLGRQGTDLGDIKAAVNRRGASGAAFGRIRRALESSAADVGASAWR